MKNFITSLCIFLIFFMGCSKTDKLQNKAILKVSEGNYEEAIEIWKEILSHDGNNPSYLNDIGWVFFRNDELEKSRATLISAKSKSKSKLLIKSIETNLDMVEKFLEGKTLLQNEDYEKALSIFTEVSSEFDTKEMEKKYIALCYEGMGKTEMAKEQWTTIIELYENSDVKNKFYELAQEKLSSKK